jgi:hypothetical protein
MSDFKTALLTDPRLSQISDSQIYAVQSGASNNTHQSYEAVSKSASSLVFNVQCPSESVVVDREILMEVKDFTFNVSKEVNASGITPFDFSSTDALGPFPLNFSFNTLTSQINNSSVTMNSKDILPFLVRLNDADRLYKYHGYTPVLPDQEYLKYSDAAGKDNNPLADGSKAGHNSIKPRGAFVIKEITYSGTAVPSGAGQSTQAGFVIAQIKCDITEPVMLSPYIFGAPDYNLGGFVGINTLNLVGNLDSKPHRIFRCVENTTGVTSYDCAWGLADGSDTNPFRGSARLLVNYLSTQSTQLIPSRQVLPYMDFPRYLSVGSSMTTGSSATVRSQNIQLNQIPDKFILAVRKKMTDQTITDSDSFFPIEKVTVSLNNQSGLLSSASAQHLWKMSQEAGSTQTWSEFSGEVGIAGAAVKTTGSMLVLSPAQHLSLSAMLSSGSIGQFSVQFDVTVKNPYGVTLTPELCLVCVNSGIMVNAAGSTAVYTGILTKELVVSTQTEQEIPPLERPEYERMVGGASCNIGSLRKMLTGKLGRMRGSSSGGAMSAGVRRFA